MESVAFLPLALSVMLGPQLLVALILITRADAVKSSIFYVAAVTSTLVVTTFIYFRLAEATDLQIASIGGRPLLKYFLLTLFAYLILKTYRNRKKLTQPPNWLHNIATASVSRIFVIGILLIALMPTDIIMAFSVGSLLHYSGANFKNALPFFGLVAVIAATPLIFYLSLGKRGPAYLGKVNQWLNTHGYLVNIVILLIFMYLII